MKNTRYLRFDALWWLMGFNISLFILPTLFALLLRSRAQESYAFFLDLLGGLVPIKAFAGEWWRVITANFLHGDLFHIAANMLSLYFVGKIIQNFYGNKFLFSFYILCGLSGSIFSIIFIPQFATVGASGAVFGLIGVLLGGSYRRNRFGMDLPFRPMDIAPIALYSFAIGLVPGFLVNNWAHLGGFLLGVFFGLLVQNKIGGGQNMQNKLIERVLLLVSLVLYFGAYGLLAVSVAGKFS